MFNPSQQNKARRENRIRLLHWNSGAILSQYVWENTKISYKIAAKSFQLPNPCDVSPIVLDSSLVSSVVWLCERRATFNRYVPGFVSVKLKQQQFLEKRQGTNRSQRQRHTLDNNDDDWCLCKNIRKRLRPFQAASHTSPIATRVACSVVYACVRFMVGLCKNG